MDDNSQNVFKPHFGAELNIESIICAPLVATSKANVMMLTGQANFVLDYCFRKDDNGKYHPIMVEMLLVQPVIDHTKDPAESGYITIEKMVFQVPLLCLLSLNSLAIDKITVDFDLEITSVGSYDSDIDLVQKKAVLNGRIAPAEENCKKDNQQYNSQVSSRLKVNINASQLPLPKGLLAILDLYTKSIQPLANL